MIRRHLNYSPESNACSNPLASGFARGTAVVLRDATDGRLRESVVGKVSQRAMISSFMELPLTCGVRMNAERCADRIRHSNKKVMFPHFKFHFYKT